MSALALFFKVPSQTTKGKYYTVRKLPLGDIRCSCPAFIFRNKCKHVEDIRKDLNLKN